MNDEILICRAEAGLGRIHFNSPRSMNALSLPMDQAFRDAALTLVADPAVRVIRISAEGRAFMAGGDLRYFDEAADKAQAAAELIAMVNEGLSALHGTSQIIVSALQGAVAGGGIGIALAADIVLASDDVSFTTAYARIAATMDCGGSAALVRRVGYHKAIELALLSDTVLASEALTLGLVNKIVARDGLDMAVAAVTDRLLAGPNFAQKRAKALLAQATTRDYRSQLEAERESFVACADTADFSEGVAAFLQKRRAAFQA